VEGGRGGGRGVFFPRRVFIEQVSKKFKTFLSFTAYVKPGTLNPTFEESSVKMFSSYFWRYGKGTF
jgi:hypothetical protein